MYHILAPKVSNHLLSAESIKIEKKRGVSHIKLF